MDWGDGWFTDEEHGRAEALVLEAGISEWRDDGRLQLSTLFDSTLAAYLKAGSTPAGALTAAVRDLLPGAGAGDRALVLVHVTEACDRVFPSFADAVADEMRGLGGHDELAGMLGDGGGTPRPAHDGGGALGDSGPDAGGIPGGAGEIVEMALETGISEWGDDGRLHLSTRFHEAMASGLKAGRAPGEALVSAVGELVPGGDVKRRAQMLAYVVLATKCAFPALVPAVTDWIGRHPGGYGAPAGDPGAGGGDPLAVVDLLLESGIAFRTDGGGAQLSSRFLDALVSRTADIASSVDGLAGAVDEFLPGAGGEERRRVLLYLAGILEKERPLLYDGAVDRIAARYEEGQGDRLGRSRRSRARKGAKRRAKKGAGKGRRG